MAVVLVTGRAIIVPTRTCAELLGKLTGNGTEYDTLDGSGAPHCSYVTDVAEARGVAMDRLADEDGLRILNIGTGTGVTVLQLVPAFQEACGDVRRRLAFAETSPDRQ